ncbi:hypothetical protein QBC37DRAFT_457526 [Rhypophila decipiens]|uniref:Polyketide synthase n=1 Tax=Rhypophila decipiens TaxID=261697 RepID=A0AAN6XZZ5_9PEZI|nr:hypothetical protein QBC37DRAFT_457526 [Rhypophila decipiens]
MEQPSKPNVNGQHPPATNGHSNNGPSSESYTNGHVHHDEKRRPVEPIAVCGMGLRLPGGINDAPAFWDLLQNKRSGRCKVPKTRFDVDNWYGPGKPGHVASKFGYFLDHVDLANMDTSFWSATKDECASMDPQQRLLLEVVYEALQTAGQKSLDLRGHKVGVFVGSFAGDWSDMDQRDVLSSNRHRQYGAGDYMLANRIHYEFGFMGPSAVIRTACSSSMVALHDACTAINSGECEAAIVAGCNLILSPRMTATMQDMGLASPSGYCHTFDAAADGYARGEAVSAVYLKKLSDALRDGDPVRSVIRATTVNSGGRAASLSSPVVAAHEALIRRCHELAGTGELSRTAMVECHGTGTPVGDPIEAQAVANVFGEHGIYIGSVKTNLGHGEGASGLSSLVKMTLALENKTIPANLNFKTPNPNIPFESCKLSVPTEPLPWPKDRDFVVGINSFGVGGSNAHAVLGSAASFGADSYLTQQESAISSKPTLLLFSAKHPNALRKMIERHQAYHLSHPDRLSNLSYSLAMKRDTFDHRVFAVADEVDDWRPKFSAETAALRQQPSLIFVFSGQGAQWARMGKELKAVYPAFEESIKALDRHLQALEHHDKPGWSLVEELLKGKKKSRLSEAEFAQPCTTALQIALVDLLRQCGLKPDAVVGHSSGEIAGAYASGALTAREAILVAYYRGKAMVWLEKALAHDGVQGGMAAVGLGPEQVTPYLSKGVLVGCENSPESTTLTGDKDALDTVLGRIKEALPHVFARELKVDRAYHSHHMAMAAPHYLAALQGILTPQAPAVPFHSSVTGQVISHAQHFGPQYWVDNLVSRVRFSTAVQSVLSLSSKQPKTFIEVGPHSTLAGPLRQILQAANMNSQADYVNILTRGQDSSRAFLEAMGELWSLHVPLNLAAMIDKGEFLPDLPLYPWHYEEPMWAESRLSNEFRFRKFPHHELLGSRVPESTDHGPSWRNMLRLEDVPWIRDHEVLGDVILPGVGFVAMAGEAVRQLTGQPDFTVQGVHINVALALGGDGSAAVEVVTQLYSLDATAWYSFSICSYRAGSCIKHVFGQVRAGSDLPPDSLSQRDMQPLPRMVSEKAWYRKFRAWGLHYGPGFQGLADTTAHPTAQEMVAAVTNNESSGSYYHVHPAALDCMAQALVVALCNGLTRNLDFMAVPTYIEELYCRRPATSSKENLPIRVRVDEQRSKNASAYTGDMTALSSNGQEVVVQARGFRVTVVDNNNKPQNTLGAKFRHGAVQLHWKPDINLLSPGDVAKLFVSNLPPDQEFVLMEQYLALAVIEFVERTRDTSPPQTQEHMALFSKWMSKFAAERETQLNVLFGPPDNTLLRDQRKEVMDRLYSQLINGPIRASAEAIGRIVNASEGLMDGTTNGLDVLMKNNLLHDVYDFMQLTDMTGFLDLVSHKKPDLRVLEIGAGTGGTTARVLPALLGSEGERMYSLYTYTDVSTGFFDPAQDRFRDFGGMEYRVLDISQDPASQGFGGEADLGSYDLVIATNVLHATPCITETLRNVRKLVHPRGRLLLQELCPISKGPNMIFGVLPGWWAGVEDGRRDEPYLDEKGWDRELRRAGFKGAETVVFDGQLSLNIVAMPVDEEEEEEHKRGFGKRVTLLVPPRELVSERQTFIVAQLQEAGYTVEVCHFPAQTGFDLELDGHVVSLLDVLSDRPFLYDMDEACFQAFQLFVAHAKERRCGILWVTGLSQAGCITDPRYAPVLGLARVLRLELGIDFATLETAEVDAQAVARVLDEFRRERDSKRASDQDADRACEAEWVNLEGRLNVGRYRYLDVDAQLNQPRDQYSQYCGSGSGKQNQDTSHQHHVKLDTRRPGSLDALYWKIQEEELPLGPEEVRVEVRAVNLNLRDVHVSMGLVTDPAKIGRGMGYECSGVVTAVGANVTRHGIGDRVVVCESGTLATSLHVSQHLCAGMPNDMSFEEAATMPLGYATASYCLDAASLTKGMSVLIHDAAAAVGLAAIQLCKTVGVDAASDIYCTVTDQDQVRHLMEYWDIPRHHIFNLGDTSFLPSLIAITNGSGVDVVLNSQSGEQQLLHASWKCVAPGGTFVDIMGGRRDFVGQQQQAKLAMQPFEMSNRCFIAFDLAPLKNQRPAVIASFLDRIMKFAREGRVKPGLVPIQTFDAAAHHMSEPFKLMQEAQQNHNNQGIVITMPANNALGIEAEAAPQSFHARSDAAYLLTGGLGGLGKSISTWLVERGARYLVFLSRSATNPSHDAFFQELACLGCTAIPVSGDVTNYDDVVRAIKTTSKPICGVLHASMVLDDNSFLDMTFDQWSVPIQPKVEGAWNLHRALLLSQPEPLDFFFLFSSFGAIFGQWGQANYSAANTFIDAFVGHRQSLGLPACSLNIGAMGDIGWLAENPEALEKIQASAYHVTNETDFLECAELMLLRPVSQQHSQLGFGLRSTLPILAPNNRVVFRKDPRILVYRNLEIDAGWAGSSSTPQNAHGGQDTNDDKELTRFLQAIAGNTALLRGHEAMKLLARNVGRKLLGFMMKEVPDDDEIDVNAPMANLGMDSLVSIELRNWISKRLGVEVNVLELTRAGSLLELGGWLQTRMIEKYQARL